MYSIKFDLKDRGKDEEFQVPGLGTFTNDGKWNDVTEEQADAYRSHHQTYEDELDENGQVRSRVVVPGPTLLQAYSGVEGITVKTNKSVQQTLPEGDDK